MLKSPFVVVTLVSTLFAGSAMAINNRSAVSVNGLDTNPCTVASPCRSFSTALAQTAVAGEVIALDSAGYGPFTISQNVSVSGAPGVHAAITVTSGDGITITGGSAVFIYNLVILGTGGGQDGIRNTGCLFVHIQNCFIEGFSGSGILDLGSYVLRLMVDHTTVDACALGVNFDGGSGSVDNSSINSCTTAGVRVFNHSSAIVSTTIVTSTIFRWNQVGVDVIADGATFVASARVEHCSFNANGYGVQVTGSNSGNALAFLTGNFIDATNGVGTYTMYSTGDNFIGFSGATLTPWALQ
jgi:hypothetical protein